MRLAFYSVFFVFVLAGQALIAKEHKAEDGHQHHQHHHPGNEIGLANNLVYLGEEGEFAYGLHLHYLRNIRDSRFGAGLGL